MAASDRAVADSAVANLKLDESPDELLADIRVDAEPETSLMRFSVDAGDGDQARRKAQELVEVFTVLYNARFGPATTASIWEAPRAEEGRVSPRPGLNLGLGAGLGALVGAGLVVARRKRGASPQAAVAPPPWGAAPPPDASVQERVAAVTARKLALARREHELAATRRHPDLTVSETVPETGTETGSEGSETGSHTVQEEVPETVPDRHPAFAEPFVLPPRGSWTVGDVERLLAAQGAAFPDRLEELGFYLASFRDVAGPDGHLPSGVEVVVDDVFGDLIERARVEEPEGRPSSESGA